MLGPEIDGDCLKQHDDRDGEEEGVNDIDKPVREIPGQDHLGDQLECVPDREEAMIVSRIATIVYRIIGTREKKEITMSIMERFLNIGKPRCWLSVVCRLARIKECGGVSHGIVYTVTAVSCESAQCGE
ncbi:MAG: hypothetical protein ABSB80_09950 [Methanoregula sp.]|jgi:hypothetical protein|uniref:hypothetical protein n=1 Tax=Methanoregula sp. TaxID=2052170 RepID=UPI003D0A793C